MSLDPSASPYGVLTLIGLALMVTGAALLIGGLLALLRARLGRFTGRVLVGALLFLIGALTTGLHGYSALSREDLAARISVRPTGEQRFEARFAFARGQTAVYELAGDELYVDAQILKWKPIVQLIGLHTLWSLDRVAGRYRSIEQERSAPRTIYPLSREPVVSLFELRRRFGWLAPFYDAEYGSASFVAVNGPAEIELTVSTSGLVLRPVEGPK
jgi:hypothetical protein